MHPVSNLARSISRKLEADLDGCFGESIPTLRQLSSRYGVSYVTMVKAARILRDRGLVEFAQGRRIRLPTPPAVVQPTVSKPVRVQREILRSVESGALRAGTEIPKYSFLARRYGVSQPTVTKAMQLLARRGVVHKEGRAWVVGEQRLPHVAVSRQEPSVVFVIQHVGHHWRGLSSADRTRRFADAFTMEADRLGNMRIMQVVVAEKAQAPDPRGRWDWQGVVKEARRLGPRYLGALIVSSKQELYAFDRGIDLLSVLDRPVVCLDRHGTDPPPFKRGNLTICAFNERAAVDCAAEALHSLGHRTVGFMPATGAAWESNRGKLLSRALAAQREPCALVCPPPLNELVPALLDSPRDRAWLKVRTQRLLSKSTPLAAMLRQYADVSSRLSGEAAECVKGIPSHERAERLLALYRLHVVAGQTIPVEHPRYDVHSDLAHLTPGMLVLLDSRDLTALVAPNDFWARGPFRWLELAGIHVPGRLSVLSFDNSRYSQDLPLSSVDFGFGHLGYMAFHAILGDIRVRRDRRGLVSPHPTISHRGSLGPAVVRSAA